MTSKKPKIYADFQKLDDVGNLVLSCAGTLKNISDQKIKLTSGLKVIFYSDDCDEDGNEDAIMVDGEIKFDQVTQSWVGIYDRNRFFHASEREQGPGSTGIS